MKNDIKDDYVSLEVAKLLKEKGFEYHGPYYITTKDYSGGTVSQDPKKDTDIFTYYPRPTHNIALKWLLENFDVTIDTSYDFIAYDVMIYGRDFEYKMISSLSEKSQYCFTAKEDAIEAALIYVLKNLK